MRIRTLFLACFCGVAVPGAAAFLWMAGSGWHAWERAEEARRVTRAVSDTQRAQTAIAMEIGGYSSLLRLPTPSMDEARQTAAGTERLLSAAAESAAAGGGDAGAVRALSANLAGFRRRIHEELAKPLEAREQGLPAASQALRNQGV